MKRSLLEESSNSCKSIKRYSTNAKLESLPDQPQISNNSEGNTGQQQDGGGYEMVAPPGSKMREAFNFYKAKDADLSKVRDVRVSDPENKILCQSVASFSGNWRDIDVVECARIGLKDPREWTVTTLESRPGLYLFGEIFEPKMHLEWMRWAYFNYCRPPNCTNNNINGDNVAVDVKNLRWATLGFDYNWTTKEYPEIPRCPLPDEFIKVGEFVTRALGLSSVLEADTAIVNYYKLNSRLSPHVDRSEKALDRALISMSFGQSAIYLSGGISPDEDVEAFMLHSGDLLVMSGDQRLVWHGVPKVLKTKTYDLPHRKTNQDIELLNYVNSHRINVTLRRTSLG